MDGTHFCVSCGTALHADDGHDLCPACLGPDHLKEGLSANPCMNCSCMPRALRVARLAQVAPEDDIPPSGPPPPRRSRRKAESTASAPPKKRARSDKALSSQVERLSAELAEMRSLFQSRQADTLSEATSASQPMPILAPQAPVLPAGDDDVLSLAASASQFFDDFGDAASQVSEEDSLSSA